jgi:hypothetical protein
MKRCFHKYKIQIPKTYIGTCDFPFHKCIKCGVRTNNELRVNQNIFKKLRYFIMNY